MRAGKHDSFEGRSEISSFVEGAVKRHLHRRGESDKFPGALRVHRAIRQQHTRRNALHLLGANCLNFFLHLGKFGRVIDEVSGARPHQHMNGQRNTRAHAANQFDIWREPTDRQISAQFQAMRTGALPGLRAFHGSYGDFQKAARVHGTRGGPTGQEREVPGNDSCQQSNAGGARKGWRPIAELHQAVRSKDDDGGDAQTGA